MRNYKNFIILFALICLTFEGFSQKYSKLFKGDRSPYDTGVIIELSEYRKIRIKVNYADSIIRSLNREISNSYSIIKQRDSIQLIMLKLIESKENQVARQSQLIESINKDFDALYNASNRKKKFFQKQSYMLGSGFMLGIITSILIKSSSE